MCRPVGARCITPPRTSPPAGGPTSTNSPWPVDRITGWPATAVGGPENERTASPNGSHPHTWTAGSAAPTPTSTPKKCPSPTWCNHWPMCSGGVMANAIRSSGNRLLRQATVQPSSTGFRADRPGGTAGRLLAEVIPRHRPAGSLPAARASARRPAGRLDTHGLRQFAPT